MAGSVCGGSVDVLMVQLYYGWTRSRNLDRKTVKMSGNGEKWWGLCGCINGAVG